MKHPLEMGELINRPELGIRLSKGLKGRIIGKVGSRVTYANGTSSELKVHGNPDAAGCFRQPDGGWIYVSNSEMGGTRNKPRGGVGGFRFDKDGNLIDYSMVQTRSLMNCGGGDTPWNTWLTGEEWDSEDPKGQVWEVDPTGEREPRATQFGRGKFESAICDDRNMAKLVCFATADDYTEGALRRYDPPRSVLEQAVETGDWSDALHNNTDGTGKLSYLLLDVPLPGMYSWTTNKTAGDLQATERFPNTEGIDHHDGWLYIVSKKKHEVTVLDLDNYTYTQFTTESGSFADQPDQIYHMIGDDPSGSSFLYFLEDGGTAPGVFGRNLEVGKYFTVVEKIPDENGDDETTGLAFCEDHMRLMFAFQDTGTILELMREDGRPFYGAMANVKYHQVGKGPVRLSADS